MCSRLPEKFGKDPIVLYASTNKVYGGMDDVPVTLRNNRWEYEKSPLRRL